MVTFEDGKIISSEILNVNLIEKGDVLQVKPGEKVPVDGRIIDGKTSCDEAFITGEAMPVNKTIGDSVTGSKCFYGLFLNNHDLNSQTWLS